MSYFIKSAFSEKDWINDDKQEFCLVGRSNVGKSSLINALANKKIAIASKTPGQTKLANFYDFGNFRLIDLPGYGFNTLSKDKKNVLLDIINEILNNRTNIFGVFHVMDISVITSEDLKISKILSQKYNNYFVIFNKIDKVSKNELNKLWPKAVKKLNISNNSFLLVSAKDNIGIKDIYSTIKKINNI